MNEQKPAYSCGDAFCCGGDDYPACQDPVKAAKEATHYEDDQHTSSACTFTD